MTIKDFELFHGAALTKLLRNDRPVSLRMIETTPAESWAAYTLNDEVILYIKHSKSPSTKTRKDALSWYFTFSEKHLNEIKKMRGDKEVFIALVCGKNKIGRAADNQMCICLLEPKKVDQCIDVNAGKTQTITVQHSPKIQLQVWGNKNSAENPLGIASNAIEAWEVPGS